MPMITNPSSFLQGFFVPFTITIFLNESGMQDCCDHPDDEDSQVLSDIPDGDAFDDFPEAFLNATVLPF